MIKDVFLWYSKRFMNFIEFSTFHIINQGTEAPWKIMNTECGQSLQRRMFWKNIESIMTAKLKRQH